jgi:hypothetical protein
MKTAPPAATSQTHHGIEEAVTLVTVPLLATAPALAGVPPLAGAPVVATNEGGATVNANEPEGTPPTAHVSDQAPIWLGSMEPATEKLPFASVDPFGVPEKAPLGMEPDTVTGLFGEAPVMATSQVSPT